MSHTQLVTSQRIYNERPVGIKDGNNLRYCAANVFDPLTLKVYLSGDTLNGDPLDPLRDYIIESVGPDTNKCFTIILNPSPAEGLNVAPCQDESLYIDYDLTCLVK